MARFRMTCRVESLVDLTSANKTPIRGRVDRASAIETIDWGSIPGGSKQRL